MRYNASVNHVNLMRQGYFRSVGVFIPTILRSQEPLIQMESATKVNFLYEIILPGPFCTEAFFFFYIFEFHVKF